VARVLAPEAEAARRYAYAKVEIDNARRRLGEEDKPHVDEALELLESKLEGALARLRGAAAGGVDAGGADACGGLIGRLMHALATAPGAELGGADDLRADNLRAVERLVAQLLDPAVRVVLPAFFKALCRLWPKVCASRAGKISGERGGGRTGVGMEWGAGR
jgi:hypothetical protein